MREDIIADVCGQSRVWHVGIQSGYTQWNGIAHVYMYMYTLRVGKMGCDVWV